MRLRRNHLILTKKKCVFTLKSQNEIIKVQDINVAFISPSPLLPLPLLFSTHQSLSINFPRVFLEVGQGGGPGAQSDFRDWTGAQNAKRKSGSKRGAPSADFFPIFPIFSQFY